MGTENTHGIDNVQFLTSISEMTQDRKGTYLLLNVNIVTTKCMMYPTTLGSLHLLATSQGSTCAVIYDL